MPLPAPTDDRTLLHTRRIVCEGYERRDGMYDIEGWLTDIKTYAEQSIDGPAVPPGQPVHGMRVRLTVDMTYTIRDAVAAMEHTPSRICGDVAPNVARLIGVPVIGGFRKKVTELIGGIEGCTHVNALLTQVATVALQTIGSKLRRPPKTEPSRVQTQINSCRGWMEGGPLARLYGPTKDTPAQ